MDESTPYENLISISFERPDGGSSGAVGSAGASSVATAGTAVKVVSMIAKRNPAVMALSAAGVAAAGAGAVAKVMSAKAVLTITTDQRVHVLTNQAKHPTTGIPMPRKDHESVGAVLEQTGNSVLTALGRGPVMSNAPALPSGQVEVSQGMSSPGLSTEDVAKRLRELAELRKEGILDDADFAIAKRQLLEKL
ncbi:SHOCT domain-containing protein [Actinomyces oris]|uniref:SHOCT domain-containing protein n=2 Tax=Actinomyces oris TaxID=544580 RepID=UPI001F082D1E|nr:SHOCT domain-containing protein [Actinomyces oris]